VIDLACEAASRQTASERVVLAVCLADLDIVRSCIDVGLGAAHFDLPDHAAIWTGVQTWTAGQRQTLDSVGEILFQVCQRLVAARRFSADEDTSNYTIWTPCRLVQLRREGLRTENRLREAQDHAREVVRLCAVSDAVEALDRRSRAILMADETPLKTLPTDYLRWRPTRKMWIE